MLMLGGWWTNGKTGSFANRITGLGFILQGFEAMNVKQLIEKLKKMPPSAEVMHLWDGATRTSIEHVWLSVSGYVVTADFDEVCYYQSDRPVSAPTEEECRYWKTSKKP